MKKRNDPLHLIVESLKQESDLDISEISQESEAQLTDLARLASIAQQNSSNRIVNSAWYESSSALSQSTINLSIKPPYSIFVPTPLETREVPTEYEGLVSAFSDADPLLGRLSLGVAIDPGIHEPPAGLDDYIRVEKAVLRGAIRLPISLPAYTSHFIPETAFFKPRHRVKLKMSIEVPGTQTNCDLDATIIPDGYVPGSGIPNNCTYLVNAGTSLSATVRSELSLRLISGSVSSQDTEVLIDVNHPQTDLQSRGLPPSGKLVLEAELITEDDSIGIELTAFIRAQILSNQRPQSGFAGIEFRQDSTLPSTLDRVFPEPIPGLPARVNNIPRGAITISEIAISIEPLPPKPKLAR